MCKIFVNYPHDGVVLFLQRKEIWIWINRLVIITYPRYNRFVPPLQPIKNTVRYLKWHATLFVRRHAVSHTNRCLIEPIRYYVWHATCCTTCDTKRHATRQHDQRFDVRHATCATICDTDNTISDTTHATRYMIRDTTRYVIRYDAILYDMICERFCGTSNFILFRPLQT